MKILMATILLCLFCTQAQALSEYGRRCDDNPDCRECRDESDSLDGLECQTCMHNCWNLYGPAEFSDLSKRSREKTETCRVKWAKWCNAQCWDPDDKKDPEYKSTKPICNDEYVFPKYQGSSKKPW